MKNDGIHDYTHLASDYDDNRYTTDEQKYLDSLRYRTMNTLLNPNKEMSIIDVGTGTGSGIIFFAKSVKNIVGLDGTEAMLNHARVKAQMEGITNVEFLHANALSIPFENDTFDNVISLNFIHLFATYSVKKQMEFISEMARICKKGGYVIVEFDNIMYLKELGNRYRDLFSMAENLRVEKIVGTYFPKTVPVFKCSRQIANLYSSIAGLPFAKRFAYRWVVKYKKI